MTSKIEQQVMASVGVIYAVRKLTSRFAFECYALLLSVAGVAYYASVPHVANNFLQVAHAGAGNVLNFILVALLQTRFAVQLAVCLGAVAFVSLVVDMTRSMGAQKTVLAL